ncbi:hypothetical protein QTP88_026049 [Uroleucon formosanum]
MSLVEASIWGKTGKVKFGRNGSYEDLFMRQKTNGKIKNYHFKIPTDCNCLSIFVLKVHQVATQKSGCFLLDEILKVVCCLNAFVAYTLFEPFGQDLY